MGLEIGFRLFDKDKFNESGCKDLIEIEPDASDTSYACGRSPATYAWGDEFMETADKTVVPVFQKDLAGFVKTTDDGHMYVFKLVEFDDFKKSVMIAVDKVKEDADDERRKALGRIAKCKEQINELREWQLKCGEDNSFAFDRWEFRINELKDDIEADEGYISNTEENDYDYCSAKTVERLLRDMQEHLASGKELVIPYDSY